MVGDQKHSVGRPSVRLWHFAQQVCKEHETGNPEGGTNSKSIRVKLQNRYTITYLKIGFTYSGSYIPYRTSTATRMERVMEPFKERKPQNPGMQSQVQKGFHLCIPRRRMGDKDLLLHRRIAKVEA